ncbi:hypothetical protein GLOIN_2v1885550 [Rhizophagus irregularis DAOM 181602=DAOM 197198]|nr:hypothetical protein GLOIN_2v1885550 [Rhizophagus irregularis DAOM 181602=DAOM 197198]
MRVDKGKAREILEKHSKTDMERQWEAANGYVDWDEENLDYHYDEAQLPDDADPDYFKRFIIYIRNAPHICQSAELTKFV